MSDDRPVLLGFRDATVDRYGHMRIQFFAGRTHGARGNCGEIVVRDEEWPTMREALLRGGFEEMPPIGEALRALRS